MTRGRERSRNLEDVVGEVAIIAQQGTTEVTLLGQTVNSYNDGRHEFGALLRAVGAVDGIERVRFTSPYPNDFSPAVVEAMATVPEVCEHVHLPVQSGSTRLLKPMGRRYTRDQYLECVDRLRTAIPNLAITTDIIVGFPGETDDDFGETVSLVREVAFDDAFTFRYSPREGTGAVRLPDAVPDEVSGSRLRELIAVVRDVARRKNVALVGSTHEVLVEKPARRGNLLQTRTRTNKVALVDGPTEWIGSYRVVRLTGTTGATFTAVPSASHAELSVIG
jgi:tRNA-2-methylthio-N6-dimethylallyladenosine synthase